MPSKSRTWSRPEAEAYAAQAQALLRADGKHDHLGVRPYGTHLLIEDVTVEPPEALARLTYCGMRQFAGAYKRHTGRWESLPVGGQLQEAMTDLVEIVGPYLEPVDFPVGTSGTDH